MSAPVPSSRPAAHPPETVEGWYALHQVFRLDRAMLREWSEDEIPEMREGALAALRELAAPEGGGWTAVFPLVGSTADVMVVHFRATLDAIGEAQRRLSREPLFDFLDAEYSFLSVTEAGLYHITAKLAREAEARGGSVGDAEYRKQMDEAAAHERASAHVQRRLYPTQPADMPYVCFYPMSKRRTVGQNWYALTLDDRSRLMHAHGMTGRRYAGRVVQVISGALGFDAWEWGVTLFARDPLEFKRIVTEMRFDEVSAEYAEFGDFYVGKVQSAEEWVASVG